MPRLVTLCLFVTYLAFNSASAATVPFIGCPSDGQTGPEPGPTGDPVEVVLASKTAARIAYYRSISGGVFAPRGWYCAGLWGSSGWILFVSPKPINPGAILTPSGIKGPIVQVSFNLGETSGRIEAAKIMARYFPSQRTFVNEVIATYLNIVPDSEYPLGPFPDDKFRGRGPRFVEYLTPADSNGLGTMSRLVPDDDPIYSAAILMDQDAPDAPSAMTVAVRLPPDMVDLAPVVLREAERQYAAAK
jgi:hypothetical protein